MSKIIVEDDWVKFEGPICAKDIRLQAKHSAVLPKLSITKNASITTAIAKALAHFTSIEQLWLWCDVTRTAMRHILPIPGLTILDILSLKHPGQLGELSQATGLEQFRCNHYLSETDLLAIATSPSLIELGAQSADITLPALEALLSMPTLKRLDLEATVFNDEMAELVGASNTLTSLDLGGTPLTKVGLQHLCRMPQLRSLDIWATRIEAADLECLADMPALEYLSIGCNEWQQTLNADDVITKIRTISTLKKIWLDGISLTGTQQAELARDYQVYCSVE